VVYQRGYGFREAERTVYLSPSPSTIGPGEEDGSRSRRLGVGIRRLPIIV